MSWIDLRKVLSIYLVVTSSFLAGCGGGGGGSSGTGTVTPSSGSTPDNSTGTGTATLKWVAPSSRLDGSAFPLSALAGYVVYTGTSPTTLVPRATINDPTATEHIIRNLGSGMHYFAIAAYDNGGRRSPMSEILGKLI